MRYLAIDTEVTGVPRDDLPLIHSEQPRVVQLAAILFDEVTLEIEALDTLFRPDGWIVDYDSELVHGWTTEDCTVMGIPAAEALGRLDGMAAKADGGRVMHGAAFDDKVLAIERAFAGMPVHEGQQDAHCTMTMTAPIVGIPFSRGGYKWPTLAQSAKRLLGRGPHPDALHNAFTDSEWCRDIFLATLKNQG